MRNQTNRYGIAGRLGIYASVGFVFGFFILHPVSMVIFKWLDPRLAAGMPDHLRADVMETILHTFSTSMLPMGIVYGLLSASISIVSGHQHAIIRRQRDILAKQNDRLTRLEEANRRSTQFMVHDLKTPLGCILGFSTLLLNQNSPLCDDESVQALKRIRRQAQKMTDQIGDHLDFARMQEGEKWQLEEIPVVDLLREAVADVSLPEYEDRIQITRNEFQSSSTWGDRRLLRRVLVNLISNALKHNTPNTQVALDFEIREQNQEVLISCTDNGGGIHPEALPTVFGVFRTDSDNASTGLGLAFCKAVVEAHGGRIWCKSEKGKGSAFLFTIPTKGQTQNDEAINLRQASAGGGG